MKTLSELKTDLGFMTSIYHSGKKYLEYNIYLMNPDTIEERVVVEYDTFIQEAQYAFAIMSILQFNMLFGSGQDEYNFKKFLNKLENNYHNSEWKSMLSIEHIKGWKKQLDEEPLAGCIRKINDLRNRYFAHLDRNPPEYNSLIIDIEERTQLIHFCESVLYKISVDVCGEYYYSTNSNNDKVKAILKTLCLNVKKNESSSK